MKRYLAVCFFIVACAWSVASANMLSPIVDFGKPRNKNNLTIDGTPQSNCNLSPGATRTIAVTQNTAKTNDVVILTGQATESATLTASVADVPGGLIWTQRINYSPGSKNILEFYAIASNVLTNDVITLTVVTTALTNFGINTFAVNGANTGSPYDPNGAIPSTALTGPASVSTTNHFTLPLAIYSMSSTASPAAGSGFTGITQAGCYQITEYSTVPPTAPQSSLSMALTTSDQNGGVGDAITQ